MHYISISFTHKNTDISIREKLSLSDESRKKEILRLLSANENIMKGANSRKMRITTPTHINTLLKNFLTFF